MIKFYKLYQALLCLLYDPSLVFGDPDWASDSPSEVQRESWIANGWRATVFRRPSEHVLWFSPVTNQETEFMSIKARVLPGSGHQYSGLTAIFVDHEHNDVYELRFGYGQNSSRPEIRKGFGRDVTNRRTVFQSFTGNRDDVLQLIEQMLPEKVMSLVRT